MVQASTCWLWHILLLLSVKSATTNLQWCSTVSFVFHKYVFWNCAAFLTRTPWRRRSSSISWDHHLKLKASLRVINVLQQFLELDGSSGTLSSAENGGRSSDGTYHGGVEAAHGGKVSWFAVGATDLRQVFWVGGELDIGQAFAPGGRGHEPQEGEGGGYQQVLAGRGTRFTRLYTSSRKPHRARVTCSKHDSLASVTPRKSLRVIQFFCIIPSKQKRNEQKHLLPFKTKGATGCYDLGSTCICVPLRGVTIYTISVIKNNNSLDFYGAFHES